MSDPFIGEIRVFANTYIPADWLPCDGSLYNVYEYQALYATIGNIYGGDPGNTFAVPNLNGRAAVGTGTAPGGTNVYALGKAYGEAGVALTENTMAVHSHQLQKKNTTAAVAVAKTAAPSATSDLGGLSNALGTVSYKSGVVTPSLSAYLAPQTLAPEGSTTPTPHENRQPFVAMYFAIATVGDFAPRP